MEGNAAGPEPRELTAVEREQIELQVRQLQLLKRRGDRAGADRILDDIKARFPDSALVWEAIGDECAERGQSRKAREAYARAHELEPTNVPIERKFAEAVFASEAGILGLTPRSEFEAATSGKMATVLSFMLPGLGQLVTGQTLAGSILLSGYLLGWFLLFLIPNGIPGLLHAVGLAGSRGGEFNPAVLLPLLMILGFYFASLLHAGSHAAKYKRLSIKPPTPPVDKEY